MKDFSRLPKWAQDDMRLLSVRLTEVQAKLDGLEGKAPTNIYWLETLGKEHPIPTGHTIRFRFGKQHDYIECRIIGKEGEGFLYLSGSRRIRISPEATNCVDIRLED